jgi:hypothetical protein
MVQSCSKASHVHDTTHAPGPIWNGTVGVEANMQWNRVQTCAFVLELVEERWLAQDGLMADVYRGFGRSRDRWL